MSTAENTRARPGDNSGDYFEAKRADVSERLAAFMEGADRWAQRSELDDDLAARANDFLTGAKRLLAEAEEARKIEKQPHINAGRGVDDAWAPIKTRIEKVIAVVAPLLTAFAKAKQRKQDEARRAAEQVAREAAERVKAAEADAAAATSASAIIEAEERAAAAQRNAEIAERNIARATAPARVGSATGLGNSRGLKIVRKAKIVSLGQALAHYRHHGDIAAAILVIANAELRHAPTVRGEKQIPSIPGIVFEETEELS